MSTVAVVAHARKSFGGGLRELREVLAREGVTDPLWYEVTKSRRAAKSARRAAAEGAGLIFVWGGDGTVQRCIDAVAGSGAAVAILPAGTANHRPRHGNSFPSGHSLGSIVCYGALLLVFLPAASGRRRAAFMAVVLPTVALVGISRIVLGVHYLSDVVGAWALGIAWLGVTAFAFELTRLALGQQVTHPVTEGLEPEAVADLRPADPETGSLHARPGQRARVAAAARIANVACWLWKEGGVQGRPLRFLRQLVKVRAARTGEEDRCQRPVDHEQVAAHQAAVTALTHQARSRVRAD